MTIQPISREKIFLSLKNHLLLVVFALSVITINAQENIATS